MQDSLDGVSLGLGNTRHLGGHSIKAFPGPLLPQLDLAIVSTNHISLHLLGQVVQNESCNIRIRSRLELLISGIRFV